MMPGPSAPSGPKMREWGKPQQQQQQQQAFGQGPQGYHKPPGFVKSGGEERKTSAKQTRTDEEIEQERQESRKRDEEVSFRDVCAITFSAFVELLTGDNDRGNAGMSLGNGHALVDWNVRCTVLRLIKRRKTGIG